MDTFILDKPFIKNKIIEIQELHASKVWRYIPSTQNTTADIISEGGKRKAIEKVLRGPEVLCTPSLRWFNLPIVESKEKVDVEKACNVYSRAVAIDESAIDLKRVSSWKKLLRITSYIYKFISKKTYSAVIKDKMRGVNEAGMKCAC